MKDCIFCAIREGKIPSTKIAETEDIIVIKDIAPKASTHYLIIPKLHIPDIQSFSDQDKELAGNMLLMAQKLSESLPEPKAFRLVVNNGAEAGQQVFHVHMHFLAGTRIPEF